MAALCKDCRWHSANQPVQYGDGSACMRPNSVYADLETERGADPECCGPNARHFEPRAAAA